MQECCRIALCASLDYRAAKGSSSKRRVGKGANRSAQSAVAQTAMSRYRRLKIEGGAFIYTLAFADRGGRCDRIIRTLRE
jgi:hypothetical protein